MKHFFKRITALTVSGILTLSLCANAFAIGTLDHFKTVRTYENQFSDIGGWYEKHVIKGYELGLFDGKDDGAFSPNANMTFGEAVKLEFVKSMESLSDGVESLGVFIFGNIIYIVIFAALMAIFVPVLRKLTKNRKEKRKTYDITPAASPASEPENSTETAEKDNKA